MHKKDTTYCYTIFMTIRVTRFLYKIAHDIEQLHCNELCVVGKSIVHLILREFVWFMNHMFQNQIAWPKGNDLSKVMNGFRELCRLPTIIDQLMLHKFTCSNRNGNVQLNIFPTNLKPKTCNFKLQSTTKRTLEMYCWDARVNE